MSFRSVEANQTKESTTVGLTATRVYIVTSGSRYALTTVGPADAYLGDAGSGRVDIDTGATEHANGALLLKIGTRTRLV